MYGITQNNTATRFVFLLMTLVGASPLGAQTIVVSELATAPVLDGSDADWGGVDGVTVPLRQSTSGGTSDVGSVLIKGGTFGEDVYFLLRWEDSSQDTQHKPFIWDAAKGKYAKGEQAEDRLALQFAIEGNYTVDWLSGDTYKADMWHWKAFRSNALGLVHDKMTIITDEPVKKAFKVTAKDGKTVYIQRPSDEGTRLYKTKRYRTKEADVMPKYILTDNPEGSVADIEAKGVWADNHWTLEIKRKLDTGHTDDVKFDEGASVQGGVAIFNHTGDDDHNISETLLFQFGGTGQN